MDVAMAPAAIPNLFIVGAPKCGTTSLYEYLRRHPQVYFPYDDDDYARVKEPNHLCPELCIADKDAIHGRDAYLALYHGSGHALWRGDASTNYLFSETAAGNIKRLSPDARVVIMLRPPVEWMRSYHSELVRHDHEDISDFHEAVAASEDRRNGRRIPESTGVPRCLDYVAMSQFAPQVERYYRAVGRDAVKVLLLEDLARSPVRTYRDIAEFLGLDTTFEPEFEVYNETPRYGPVERFLRQLYRQPGVKSAVQHILPRAARRRSLHLVRRRESRRVASDPRDQQLLRSCGPDIEQLSALIARDLDHWKAPMR